MYDNSPAQMEQCASGTLAPRQETTRERLLRTRTALSQQLADLDSAIAALDANPGSEQLLDALSKVGRHF